MNRKSARAFSYMIIYQDEITGYIKTVPELPHTPETKLVVYEGTEGYIPKAMMFKDIKGKIVPFNYLSMLTNELKKSGCTCGGHKTIGGRK